MRGTERKYQIEKVKQKIDVVLEEMKQLSGSSVKTVALKKRMTTLETKLNTLTATLDMLEAEGS